MDVYFRMYTVLCCAIDKVLDSIEKKPYMVEEAEILQRALYEAENIYIDAEEKSIENTN